MRSFFLFSLSFLISFTCYSQRFDWVDYGVTNSLSSIDNAIASDGSGNIYSFHTFTGSAVIKGNTIAAPYGQTDCMVVKYDSTGNYIWSKVFGGSWFDYANKIAVDASGHVYVTCMVQDSVRMNDTVFVGPSVYQVMQFDSSGNFLRVKFIPGLGTCALAALGNNAYIAYGATVEKLDTSMITVWNRTASAGSLTFYSKGDLYVTPSGRLIASGAEEAGNPVVFDTISFSFSAGGFDEVFVISMDTSGTAFWGRSLYGTSSQTETTFGAAGDDAGNVYMTLQTQAQLVFGNDTLINPLGNPNNNYTAILRYDNSGNEIWGRALYPTGGSDFYDVMVNEQDEILIAGNFMNGTAVFEQFNFNVPGGAFVIKTDINGNALWEKHDSFSSSTKHFKGITQLSPGKYATTGFFNTNFQLDCFYGGFSSYGFFTAVMSENPAVSAAFSVTAVSPNVFNFNDLSSGLIQTWSWEFPGGIPAVSSDPNPPVIYTTPGNYTVTLVVCDGICCDTITQQIVGVSLAELSADVNRLIVYPNPGSSEISITGQGIVAGNLEVLNVAGKKVTEYIVVNPSADGNGLRIDIASLSPGIYFVRMNGKEGEMMGRFVKQ